ncbi:S-layer protein [Picosynechococcus sp. PCC 11901]|uniref:iron uptake porin n=1 Tax=Picosynechococcus sp. PCC 11901 TaxID=2579791 RepID=UPI0010FBC720|nr:iron uptake porin [Picosynechococcus sp. PCC 11901]QCS49603.1 S-layer protein [Picosynechococcus sp. PCC 11901]
MSKTVRTFLSGASVALGATVAFSGTAQANTELLDQINSYSQDDIAQVNSVFQLSDVSPSDWAFDALRNLVENYNCIVGYPDGTFRGSRPLSRYEFAAGLNACLQQIERMIQSGTGEVTAEDLAALRRLVNEFEAELATLGARVDDLEGRVEFLEDNQFSTTTKLNGEVIFNIGAAFGEDDIDDQVTFSDRVRLNLDTSFTGRDRLRTRLEAGNITAFDDATGVETARLGFDTFTGEDGNDVEIGKLFYRFPVGDNVRAYVGAVGLGLDDMFDVTNPYFDSSGSGALSRFGRFNPIYRGPDGAGAGFNFNLGDKFTVSAAYLAGDGDVNNPAEKNGLFNGSYTAAAQLDFAPSDRIMLSAVYANRYQKSGDINLSGSTGSDWAKRPFMNSVPMTSDNFGLQASWMVSNKLNLAGWVGYTSADVELSGDNRSADIWNWAVNAALLDVGGDGNVLGFIFGQAPKLTGVENSSICDGSSCDDTTYLAELQYRYKLNDNITITPGAYVVFNPNQNDDNDTVVVGSVRTTFSF